MSDQRRKPKLVKHLVNFIYSCQSLLQKTWVSLPSMLPTLILFLSSQRKVDSPSDTARDLQPNSLLVRLVAGPACDRFGPRVTFAACLFAGAIPTALAGAVTSVRGLLALRFFIGILGGSFVPCQVWSTGFFDKNVVGSANAFTGGLGNAGGGITYFLMPAIFDSLVYSRGLSEHVAWRVAFIVPFICIVTVATALLILCPDTPTGKWSERHLAAEQNLASHGITGDIVDVPGGFADKKAHSHGSESPPDDRKDDAGIDYATGHSHTEATPGKMGFTATGMNKGSGDHEAQIGEQQMLDTARGEVVQKPTIKEAAHVVFSLQTLVCMGGYFCSFGAELAINSILGAYYIKNFPFEGQTGSGNWAAMFGLLNVAFRPMGGIISDYIYRRSNVWGKKFFLHGLALITGVFLIAIGLTNSHDANTMFGLVAGMAFFLEAGNGANFSLVPHVHPHANGMSCELFSVERRANLDVRYRLWCHWRRW